jgi:hypothetical protein
MTGSSAPVKGNWDDGAGFIWRIRACSNA